mmetsp:Transcript_20989/g.21314  ORF Transcript_20989/g.21314 Transcript_20989/m.21314 type:complete len:84 (-) Transcript_20989:124-375(-)
MKHPTAVAGVIVPFAPIWGLQHTLPKLDGGVCHLHGGLALAITVSEVGGTSAGDNGNVCDDTLLDSCRAANCFGCALRVMWRI